MALETINVGNFINDGTGDDLRTAFSKINSNFSEINLQQGQNNTITNIGTGSGIFKEKVGVDFRLKSLKEGQGITLTSNNDEILITNNRNMILTINANTGTLTASSATQSVNIIGINGVNTSITGDVLSINGSLELDPSPKLSTNLNVNNHNIINANIITANTFNGNVNGINVTSLNEKVIELGTFDFGYIYSEVTNPIQWLLVNTIVDMGSFIDPNPNGIDYGSFV